MTREVTPRQRQILELIRRAISQSGYPPTRAEIAAQLGFRSVNAAEEHLRALARKGLIEITPGASRGLRLLDTEVGLPIIGKVAAGNPILAQENIEGHCAVAATLFRPAADYFLRVSGDSMKDIGILDGDLLAVHKTAVAESGQIVVARIGDEVTVKRLQKGRNGSGIALLAANPDFEPIRIDPQRHEFVIEGLGVGVIRAGC
ncbi:MAG: transcriptional repressor LexA [Porticoccaceae bacterium]